MSLSQNLLDRLILETDATSDYQIAKMLEVRPTTVYRWRKGVAAMDDAALVRVAELLGENPMNLIATVQYQRARTERELKVWAKYIRNPLAVALLCSTAMLYAPNSEARTTSDVADNIYTNTVYYVKLRTGSEIATSGLLLSAGNLRPVLEQ